MELALGDILTHPRLAYPTRGKELERWDLLLGVSSSSNKCMFGALKTSHCPSPGERTKPKGKSQSGGAMETAVIVVLALETPQQPLVKQTQLDIESTEQSLLPVNKGNIGSHGFGAQETYWQTQSIQTQSVGNSQMSGAYIPLI